MRYFYCFIISLIVFNTNITGQSFWAYTAGSVKEDEVLDICYDNSGNIISTGYFSGTTTFAAGITLTSSSIGIPDIYITKSNSSGQVIWTKKAGGMGSDRALSVACDQNGNIYITGYFYGTANFGSITLSSVSGSQDGFIAKLDANGNFLWAEAFGGTLSQWGNSIVVDANNNPVVTGQFQGTTNFSGMNLTSMINPLTSFSSFDIFVAKYNPGGGLNWVRQGKAKFDDRGLDIVSDNQSNLYICGQFSDTIQFQNTYNNAIKNSAYIIKYDASGQEMWFRKMPGVFSIAYSMAIENTGNIYITGDFKGTLSFFGPTSTNFINGPYQNKMFLLKITNTGNFVWGKADASDNFLSARNVALDANQDPYIFGEFGCTHSEYSALIGPTAFNSIGFQDFFITKYSGSGNRMWFKHFGGPRNDKAHGLLLSSINKPIMAGSFENRLNIPSSSGTLNFTNITLPFQNIGPSQPSNYCSASGNYSDYYSFSGKGYSDGFIFSGIDLTRNTYDYYERSGTGCSLNFIKPCIESILNIPQCPDTIPICLKDSICVYSHTGNYRSSNTGTGPFYKYTWNGNLSDSLQKLLITTSGYQTIKLQTLDGCYTGYDTIYTKVNPLPQPPTISDNLNFNQNHLPWANPVIICGPATVTLTAGNLHNNSFQWTGPAINTLDSSAIVNTTGTYSIIVTNSVNCTDTNAVRIRIDSPLPTIVPKALTDSIEICSGKYKTLIICDSLTNPTYSYPYSCIPYTSKYAATSAGLNISPTPPLNQCDLSFFVSASTTGMHYYTLAYVFNNTCGSDTIFYSDSIYVKVNQSPSGTLNLFGNPIICPGDTTLISFTITNLNSMNIVYNYQGNDSVYLSTPGIYYFGALLTDTVSGCTEDLTNTVTIQNKPNPFIILNPYNAIICPNDSINLAINLAPAASYEWHGPTGIIPGNNQSIYANISGFYHCIVTDTSGCVFTTNTEELRNYATPYILSTPGNIICPNQISNLHVITIDSTLINWYTPLGGAAATQTINTPGTYSCSVTMCNINSLLSIDILGSNPTASITATTLTACPYDSISLYGNAGMASYIWQPGNYTTQNITTQTSGSYSLEIMDAYGCAATSPPVTITFSSNVQPPLITVNDTICAGQSATLTASTSASLQIDWFYQSGSGMPIGNGNSFTTPNLTNTISYYAASVDASGCHSLGLPVTAYISPLSDIPVLIADTSICNLTTLSISTQTISGATYNWSGPGISGNTNPSIFIPAATQANSGLYTLQLSDINCTSPTASITIHVLNPTLPLISNRDTVCENNPYVFVISPSDSTYAYNWQGPGLNITTDSLIILSATLSNTGTYSVTASLMGCSSPTSTLQLTVLPTPPTPTLSSNSPICEGDTLFLSSVVNTNYVYNWYGPANFSSTQSNTYIPSADTSKSGIYYGAFYNGYCYGPVSNVLAMVIPYPIMSATNDTTACDDFPLTLNCQSNNGNYLWSNGSTNSSIAVTQTGTYWVTSQNGACSVTDSIHVTMVTCNGAQINVFSPNGDGVNDIFMFREPGIKNVRCEIVNRWGELVGKFEGPENGWNGTNLASNSICQEGTYFYVAEITRIDGASRVVKGFLTLVRN